MLQALETKRGEGPMSGPPGRTEARCHLMGERVGPEGVERGAARRGLRPCVTGGCTGQDLAAAADAPCAVTARARPTHAAVPPSSGIPRVSGSKRRCLPWFAFAFRLWLRQEEARCLVSVCLHLWSQALGRVPWAWKTSQMGSPLPRGHTSGGFRNVTVCSDWRL